MESTKTETIQQPLLKRAAVTYRVAFEGATPARTAIVQHLSNKEKGAAIVVTHIFPINGQQAAIVHAHVYTDEKVRDAVERANLVSKQQPAKKAEESA
jgi:ribosomal protein S24E